MAPTQTPTQLAVRSEALELSVPVQALPVVPNGRESEPSAWLAAHAAGRRWSESWMREIRTSSSMRGRRKRATAQRACALLYLLPPHLTACAFCRRHTRPTAVGSLPSIFWVEFGAEALGFKARSRRPGF